MWRTFLAGDGPEDHRKEIREEKDGSLTLVLLKSFRDQLRHLYGENQSCPQPTAERVRQRLYSAPSFWLQRLRIQKDAPRTQNCARRRRHAAEMKTYPERVKQKGCCQDQREVRSHGGGRAGGRASERASRGWGWGHKQGRLGILPPGWSVNSRLLGLAAG